MEWIKHNLLLGSMAVMIPVFMWGAKKYLPSLAKKYTDIFLKVMINPDISDLYVREQVIIIIKAAMRIAEHTMASEVGTAKMTWVIDYVCAKTSLNRTDVALIAQEIYNNIESELKEHGEEIASIKIL